MKISVRSISPEGKHTVVIVEGFSLNDVLDDVSQGKKGDWCFIVQEHVECTCETCSQRTGNDDVCVSSI
jgi:hypothetical protein